MFKSSQVKIWKWVKMSVLRNNFSYFQYLYKNIDNNILVAIKATSSNLEFCCFFCLSFRNIFSVSQGLEKSAVNYIQKFPQKFCSKNTTFFLKFDLFPISATQRTHQLNWQCEPFKRRLGQLCACGWSICRDFQTTECNLDITVSKQKGLNWNKQ